LFNARCAERTSPWSLLDPPCVVARDVSDGLMLDEDARVDALRSVLRAAPVVFSAIFGVDVLVPELAALVPALVPDEELLGLVLMPELGVPVPLT